MMQLFLLKPTNNSAISGPNILLANFDPAITDPPIKNDLSVRINYGKNIYLVKSLMHNLRFLISL